MMARPFLLVIEDDETIALSLKVFFEGKNFDVATVSTGAGGIAFYRKEIPDLVILDLRLPDMYGIDVLRTVKGDYPEISIIVMTGYGEVEEAVKAMKLGAEYYFQKPIDLDELAVMVDKSLGIRQIKQEAALYRNPEYPIVGKSPQTQGLIHMINLLASNSSTTVLIRGETGTGKELVARNIHSLSSRSNKSPRLQTTLFCAIN
jgi:two-component system response regulator AtoC